MRFPKEVLELENRSLGRSGEPTLAAAYEVLIEQWEAGSRDREVGLHLMFLAWYLLCEPGFLTGLDRLEHLADGLPQTFNQVHDYFAPTIDSDVEMLYVVGLMSPFLRMNGDI